MKQFQQQILPAGFPPPPSGDTAPWRRDQNGLLIHNAPRSTIEAQWNRPVRIKWINDLVDANGQLPAAPASRGPDAALGQPARRHYGRDTRPTFTEHPAPTRVPSRS